MFETNETIIRCVNAFSDTRLSGFLLCLEINEGHISNSEM